MNMDTVWANLREALAKWQKNLPSGFAASVLGIPMFIGCITTGWWFGTFFLYIGNNNPN
jgi:hypothetical protein